MSPSDAFVRFLDWSHNLTPDDVELSDVRGYWRVKKPCPGGIDCRHAARIALGPCDGGLLTISYSEHGVRDSRGRFVRPYREWERQREP